MSVAPSPRCPPVGLITGAGGGIGRAIARQLARDGLHLALIDVVDPAAVAEECRALGLPALPMICGHLLPQQVRETVAAAVQQLGGLHVVVNVAGICPRTPWEEIAPEEWDRVLAINLRGPFLVAQAAWPALKQAGWGRVVNIASLAGQVGGIAVGAHYVASKAGLVGLTKSLALAGAAHGITANAVAPGIIDTDMTREANPQQQAGYLERIPLGWIGEAQDVAAAVAFLCSDQARYITGSTLDVNGGVLMRC